MPANNRGPSLLGALKLTNRQDYNPMQVSKGHSHSPLSRQSTVSSEGNPLISKPILHSSSKPPTASHHPHQQQTLPTGRKASEQSVEDLQLDSFDDTDSESDVEEKPTVTAIVNSSTPSVANKKLPGLSFSFDKAPFATQLTLPEEKEKEMQAFNDKVSATEVTLDKPASTMMDTPAAKETEGLLANEKHETVSVKKDDISSDFDSSPPLSTAEDDHFKHFSSDSEEDDDVSPTAYVPSVGNGLTKRSHTNSSTGRPQKLMTTQKEKDKILELAHSSLLEMEETSKKSDPPKSDLDKTDEGKDAVESGTPSHNPGTFSPITPLPDQVDGPGMFPSDAKPTNKKLLGSSATADHVIGVTSPSSGSDSSLHTDSVIRQAEEIERSMENPTNGDQGEVGTTLGHEKSDKQQSEGNNYNDHH